MAAHGIGFQKMFLKGKLRCWDDVLSYNESESDNKLGGDTYVGMLYAPLAGPPAFV